MEEQGLERGRWGKDAVGLVVRTARELGVTEAVARYGVPRAVVQYWLAVAERLGVGVEEAARRHGVCAQTIRNWCRELERERRAELPARESAGAPVTVGDDEVAVADGATLEPDGGFTVSRVDPATWAQVSAGRERVGKRYTPTQKAAAVAQAVREGVAQAARAAGATPQTVYRWLAETLRAAGEPVARTWEQTDVEKQRDLETTGATNYSVFNNLPPHQNWSPLFDL